MRGGASAGGSAKLDTTVETAESAAPSAGPHCGRARWTARGTGGGASRAHEGVLTSLIDDAIACVDALDRIHFDAWRSTGATGPRGRGDGPRRGGRARTFVAAGGAGGAPAADVPPRRRGLDGRGCGRSTRRASMRAAGQEVAGRRLTARGAPGNLL